MIPGKTFRNGGRAVLSSLLLAAGCLHSPAGPTTLPSNGRVVGNGELKIHSTFSVRGAETQDRDGTAQFNIWAENGAYRVEGNANMSFEEKITGTNCNWTARTGGWATVGGTLSNCRLKFDVTIVWEELRYFDIDCPFQPGRAALQKESFTLGPMPLVNDFPFPQIATNSQGEWIGDYESKLHDLWIQSSIGCPVTTQTP
jgi:hypothetical protein